MGRAAFQPFGEKGRFRTRALLGFVFIIALLGGGLALDLAHLRMTANAEMDRLHEEEANLVAVERLRASNMAVVSAVRGYFITGHDSFLRDMNRHEEAFEAVFEDLELKPLSPESRALLSAVEQAAEAHRRAMHLLVGQKSAGVAAGALSRTFEASIPATSADLNHALDQFTLRRNDEARAAHEAAQHTLGRSVALTRWVTVALMVIAVGFAWYYSRLLARAYLEQQRALEAARKAAAARDELIAVVAHDLRNPLLAINLKSAALRATATSPEQREHAQTIETITAQMSALTTTMLDVAKIEAGRLTVSPAPCEVADLLHLVRGLFAEQAGAAGVALSIGAEAGLRVNADWERVMQVFSNLVGNAVKFSAAGGRVSVGAERAGAAVRFTVTDTGPGMAADELPHVFDRFWRGRRKGQDGSGLGLFIAKGIVEAHGGRIWATSAPGAGATFAFELPAA